MGSRKWEEENVKMFKNLSKINNSSDITLQTISFSDEFNPRLITLHA